MEHDHLLLLTGVLEGIPMWDLVCAHAEDAELFTQGGDECLMQIWFENEGLSLVGTSDHSTPNGLLLWTTYDYDGEPLMVGRGQYEEWKENQE